jgi:tetratricopeptide (TPR) repeat protein
MGGDHDKALEIFYQILDEDSSSADVAYYLGKSLLAQGEKAAAFLQFCRARDLDLLRFRAPGYFNDIIRSVAENNDIPMLDLETIFRAASTDSIPGDEMFFEHLHPNFDGYRLMAQAFFEMLSTIQFINPPQKIGWNENLLNRKHYNRIVDTYRNDLASVTSLDLEIGSLRNFFLVNRWPFSSMPADFSMYRPFDSNITAALALQHIQLTKSWDQIHYELANYYISQKAYQEAYNEYRAVNLTYYENYYPHLKIGDLYTLQGKFDKARILYKRALQYNPDNPNILIKLGHNSIYLKQLKGALDYFQRVIALDADLKDLNKSQKTTFYYLFALSHANLKNWTEADKYLAKSLHENSEFAPALKLRSEIQNYLQSEIQ